ncbi:MAG: DUF4214 domain-containing protein [Pirellulales bacterium]|nr:DUF4214 domain-containing protein [Pirellulales bacterium]
MLAWDSIFSGGILVVQTPEPGDTGVLRIGNFGVIELDGSNTGNWVSTGAVFSTLLGPIFINVGDTPNARFIIDNNGPGGYFRGVVFDYNGGGPPNNPIGTVGSELTIRFRNNADDIVETRYLSTNYDFNNQQQIDPAVFPQDGSVWLVEGTRDVPVSQIYVQPKPNLVDDMLVRYVNLRSNLNLDLRGGNDTLTTFGTIAPDGADITGTNVNGLGANIVYSNVEQLQVALGPGNDVMRLTGTTQRTLLAGGGGNDFYWIISPIFADLELVDGNPGTDQILVEGTAGEDQFFVDASTILGVGATITYTPGNTAVGQIFDIIDFLGNAGNDTLTIQMPPVYPIPFISDILPQIRFTGDDQLSDWEDLLVVLGHDQGAGATGIDDILVANFDDGEMIEVAKVEYIAIFGLSGDDTIENASFVPSILVGGHGRDTLIGSDLRRDSLGRPVFDIILGGEGRDTIDAGDGDDYLFPDYDEFGTLWNEGREVVDAGDGRDTGVFGIKNAQFQGDLDDRDLPSGFNDMSGERTAPTVNPLFPTAHLYQVTQALLFLEEAFRTPMAVRVFGPNRNLRGQFASFDAFVARAYITYLERDPDPQGLAFWVNRGQQGMTVEEMQAAILASNEYTTRHRLDTDFVRTMFVQTLNRLPTNGEISYYFNRLQAGVSRYNVALEFLRSPTARDDQLSGRGHIVHTYNQLVANRPLTAQNKQAMLADLESGFRLDHIAQAIVASDGDYLPYVTANSVGHVGFVSAIYRDVLRRAATLDEARFWTGVRTNGVMDRNLVASSIVNSAERRMLVIQDYYQALLGRAADPGGLQFWLSLTLSGAPLEQVLAGIAASEEYFQRQGATSDGFVRGLYRDVLGRIAPPSQPELDFWIARLGIAPRGPQAARADVALGFALSDEYRGGLIDGWFLEFLGRSASTQERDNLLDLFHRGASQARVIVEILLTR